MGKIIGVDCDLTIARSDTAWWDWLNKIHNLDLNMEATCNQEGFLYYDLAHYFPDGKSIDRDNYDFWRSDTCYDFVEPTSGSVAALSLLHDKGFEIVVVSTVKGNHHKNKWQFLKRHFPFIDGFIATKEKKYIMCDYFVDDRNDILNKIVGPEKILYYTPYTQKEILQTKEKELLFVSCRWEEISNYILNKEGML